MSSLGKNSIIVGAAVILLLFLIASVMPYEQNNIPFTVEAGTEEGECIDYETSENTIAVDCNASFLDVIQTINDPDVIENLGNGEYLLNANLEVDDDAIFEMTSNHDNLLYLKIADENGIIVNGKILIDGVKITSWDIFNEDVIQQNINGTIRRGYMQFAESEGSQIINSEFGYLGDVEPGRRGFDLFGGDGPSHDMVIRGSKFHDMWMAFYSNGAYNITIDGNEYYNNIKYSLDPHTGTHDMNITNNWLHHNPIGVICSDDCYNILIDGNKVDDNTNAGIFFSRNMTNSIARNNDVDNTNTGILLSESPNNQIYDNTIGGATEEGILLFNPDIQDDGSTAGNLVYNNFISDSDNGIRATRSHNNIVQNTTFSDIESNEYRLLGDSSIIIIGQQFDNALISGDDSVTGNLVEIVNSGTIEVTEGETDDDEEEAEEEGEGDLYNTDNEPFRRTLSDGDSITVNSS
jgi:poly(beta-D-mannuronate) C5 epimerase